MVIYTYLFIYWPVIVIPLKRSFFYSKGFLKKNPRTGEYPTHKWVWNPNDNPFPPKEKGNDNSQDMKFTKLSCEPSSHRFPWGLGLVFWIP